APQALWTAARYHLAVVVVVLDNREYRILKQGLHVAPDTSARPRRYIGLDIGDPDLDFAALARSMGVQARSVASAEELDDAIAHALEADEPHLLHVPIAGHTDQCE